MPLDGKLLIQAKKVFAEERRRNAAKYIERVNGVYEKAPIIRALDDELKETMMELVRMSLGNHNEDKVKEIQEKNIMLQKERYNEIIRAGYPGDYLDENYICSKCNDSGYVNTEICDCLLELYKKEQALSLSSLLKLGNETFDNFNLSYYDDKPFPDTVVSPRESMEMIYNICVEYSNNFGSKSMNLFFNGAPGLGKTFLSACIARVVADKGFSVVYDMATVVFSKFEDVKFNKLHDSEEAFETRLETKRYLECDLLILDDLGTEMTTEFTTSTLYEIINTRLITNHKTIVSSNLTLDEFRRRYSEQITSRLEGEYQVLTFRGKDIRKLRGDGF